MVINLNNPISKIVYVSGTFHVVAHSATRNAVFFYIPNIVVDSVNAVKCISSCFSFWLINLIWLYATIATQLLRNASKKLFVKIPFYSPVSRVELSGSVKSAKRAFSRRKLFSTAAINGISALQGFCKSPNFFTAITDTQKSSGIFSYVWKPSNDYETSKSSSSQINKAAWFTPAIRLSIFPKLSASHDNCVSTFTKTYPFCPCVFLNRSLFNYGEFSINVSDFVGRRPSGVHSLSLKRDLRRLAMLLSRQHLFKSLEVMNEKIAYRFRCLDTSIIS